MIFARSCHGCRRIVKQGVREDGALARKTKDRNGIRDQRCSVRYRLLSAPVIRHSAFVISRFPPPLRSCIQSFREHLCTMTAQETIIADLEALPAAALQKVADFVHDIRQRSTADRQAAFEASFGCMTGEEADAFVADIEDGCERVEP